MGVLLNTLKSHKLIITPGSLHEQLKSNHEEIAILGGM